MSSAAPKISPRLVRFDDMVICVNERVDDPSKAGVDRYVGLEHLDSESLRIQRWGVPSDVEATKLRFRKGDIIFGRRRAYQRKLAVADFDGICSAHAMVLRAQPKTVVPEFLPFFMQSDLFMERALAISVGSLSPTINWNALAREEFVLPSLEDQGNIARLLHAAISTEAAYARAAEAGEAVVEARTRDLFTHSTLASIPETTLSSVCTRIGVGIASSVSHAYRASGVPIIRNTDIQVGRIDTKGLLFIDPDFDELHRTKRVRAGDLVITRTATDMPGEAAVIPKDLHGAQTFTTLICTPDPQRLDPNFLCHWINGLPGQTFIASRRGGSGQKNLNATLLEQMPIRLPTIHRQRAIVEELNRLKHVEDLLQKRRQDSAELVRSMRERVLRKYIV